MRLIFFGSSPFALPTLASLTRSHEVVGIVTQPDRPAGRGGKLRATPVGEWVEAHAPQIELHKPENVNQAEIAGKLRDLAADAWVVIAFGQKLSAGLLEGVFAINLHASLLPRWRGAAPIQAAILAGDSETGNSVITLAEKMDAGLVLARASAPIGGSETSEDLHDRLAIEGSDLIERVLGEQDAGTVRGEVQDEQRVTLARKISGADAWVRFDESSERCRCRINALSPKPGVRVEFREAEIKLLRARAETEMSTIPNQEPGAIVDPGAGLVACGGGTLLRVLEAQPAGKKAMAWGDFARGQRIGAGERLIGA